MTRFLKLIKHGDENSFLGGCLGCIFYDRLARNDTPCVALTLSIPFCGTHSIYIIVPRPPAGTRCRDLEGNIKVVGRDV